MGVMTRKQHITRHNKLHEALDELLADYISHTSILPSQATIMDLVHWSYEQTKNPTEVDQ